MFLIQSKITDGIYICEITDNFVHYLIVDDYSKATLFKTKELAQRAKKMLKYSHINTKCFKIVNLEQKANKMKIYLVKQTQPAYEYIDKTIYAFKNKADAIKKARELNREYGECCKFSKNFDFVEIEQDYYFENAHYYTVETIELN